MHFFTVVGLLCVEETFCGQGDWCLTVRSVVWRLGFAVYNEAQKSECIRAMQHAVAMMFSNLFLTQITSAATKWVIPLVPSYPTPVPYTRDPTTETIGYLGAQGIQGCKGMSCTK